MRPGAGATVHVPGVEGGSVRDLLDGAARAAAAAGGRPVARSVETGFVPLDGVLGGGLRRDDLVLVGGRPGVGKTVFALQLAAHAASTGTPVVYVCYEHGPETLLARLLAMELGGRARPDEVPALEKLRRVADEVAHGGRPVGDLLAEPLGEEAVTALAEYADRLRLVRASGTATGLDGVASLAAASGEGALVVVDYLQKVPVPGVGEGEHVLRVTEGLKELAMTHGVTVLALAAADHVGLVARRLRLHHLRGSSALAHECDVALMLNDKHICVAKAHLAYHPARADTFRRYVVVTVEKNRDGPAPMDVELRKDFESYRFDPQGSFVAEQLVDDVLFTE